MKKFAKVMAVVLVCMMAVAMLAACAPNSDPDKAVAALKKNGYTALKVDAILGVGGLKCTVTGSKTVKDKNGDDKVESVTITYYEAAENAKSAFEKIKSENKDSDVVCGQSGKMVWVGTKAAVNAAR